MVNHVHTVEFGSMAFDLNFNSSSEKAFTGVKGVVPTNAETVTYKPAELRDG